MTRTRYRFALSAMLAVCFCCARPQDDPNRPLSAKTLAGVVHMASQKNTALSTVLVEECNADWSRVLASTRTDYQGHFSLKPATRKKVHYLRLSAKGFETREYEVTLSHDGPPELNLELVLTPDSQGGASRRPAFNFFAGSARMRASGETA